MAMEKYSNIQKAVKDLIPGPQRCQDYIVEKYLSGTRWYHGDSHIVDVLNKACSFFNDAKHSLSEEQQFMIKVALLCHDLIYDIPNFDGCSNEQKSAMAFTKVAYQCNWSVDDSTQFITDVAKLIRYTEYSNNYICDSYSESLLHKEHKIIHDIDFSSLGGDYINFVIDGDNIRKEYWQYEDEIYETGRKAFLKSLLDKRIYLTDYYHNKYEEKAKENIKKYLEERE